MWPKLLKSDRAFRFYAPITLHFLDLQVWHGTRIRGIKVSLTQKPSRILPWKVFFLNQYLVMLTVSKLLLVSKRLIKLCVQPFWNYEGGNTNVTFWFHFSWYLYYWYVYVCVFNRACVVCWGKAVWNIPTKSIVVGDNDISIMNFWILNATIKFRLQ